MPKYRLRDKATGFYLVSQINDYWVPCPNGPSTLVNPEPEWERIPEACQTFNKKDAQAQQFLLSLHPHKIHASITTSLAMIPKGETTCKPSS